MQGYNAIVVFDEMADKNPVSNTQTKYRRRHSSSMEHIAKFLSTIIRCSNYSIQKSIPGCVYKIKKN